MVIIIILNSYIEFIAAMFLIVQSNYLCSLDLNTNVYEGSLKPLQEK